MYKNTREASNAQEKAISKSLSADRTPNSGAGKFAKGDLYMSSESNGSTWLIEAKTCMQPKRSFSIKREWLDKMKEEQYATRKDFCALCFDFGDNKGRFYVIDENTFKNLV